MTVWYPPGKRVERVELKREAVESERDWYVRAAMLRDNGPTTGDRELGLDSVDVAKMARGYRAQADRLTKVLACVDAGAAELPQDLYP